MPSADAIVVGIVTALPAFVQRLLAGGRAVRLDGLELEPDIQLLLALQRLRGERNLDAMTPAEARVEIARGAASFAGTLLPVARVESLTLPGAAREEPLHEGRQRGDDADDDRVRRRHARQATFETAASTAAARGTWR